MKKLFLFIAIIAFLQHSYAQSSGINIASGAYFVFSGSPFVVVSGADEIKINGNYVKDSETLKVIGTTSAEINGSSTTEINNLLVDNTAGITVKTDNTLTVNTLTVNNGAKLIVYAGKKLTVSSTITNNAGNSGILIKSTGLEATGTGSLLHSTANVSATVERYLTGSNTGAVPNGIMWYVSAPINNEFVDVFTPVSAGNYNKFWKHEEAVGYTQILDAEAATTAMNVGKGFIVRPWNATNTFQFEGNLNSGDVVIPCTNSVNGWNLIGNPYPSPIDWAKVATNDIELSNVYNTVIFRTGEVGARKFVTYNGVSNYATDINYGAETNEASAISIIPAMQAFWVNASGAGSVTFKNSARVHTGQAFYKNEDTNPIIRINVAHNEFKDQTIIYFNDNASDNFDEYDSPKFDNSTEFPEIYTMSAVKPKLAINGFNKTAKNQIIPLGFKTLNQGEFEIEIVQFENFEAETVVFFEDTETGIIIDLNETSIYNFYSEIAETESRFRIIINPSVTLLEELLNRNSNDLNIFSYSDNLVVAGNNLQASTIEVFNLNGQCVFSGILANENHNLIELKLNTGIYMARVNRHGTLSTKKIIISSN